MSSKLNTSSASSHQHQHRKQQQQTPIGEETPSSSSSLNTSNSIKLTSINEHFQCGICNGYITDATTITNCLHSFCKPCIFHFFGTIDHSCPTCNTCVKDLNESIRSDSQLQRLIYNMVPGLLEDELAKREKYYLESSSQETSSFHRRSWVNLKLYNEQMGHHHRHRHHQHQHHHHKHQHRHHRRNVYVRYIQCLAETPIHIISKLIRNKHNVPLHYKITLTHQRQLLKESETLLEAFTSFIVDKDDLFDIKYEIRKIKNRRSLKNIENKIAEDTNNRHTRTSSCSSTSSSPSPVKRLAPLRTDVETSSKKTSLTQLPSPTQSTSTSASSSSSSSSRRLKTAQFLKVKFKNGANLKPKKVVVTSKKSKLVENDVDMPCGSNHETVYETPNQTTMEEVISEDDVGREKTTTTTTRVEEIQANENSQAEEKLVHHEDGDEMMDKQAAKEIVNEMVERVEEGQQQQQALLI